MTRPTAPPRRGWWRWAMLVVSGALLLVVAVAVGRGELVGRLLHPRRYAVSGEGRLPADAYVAAARGALARNERIAALRFPDGIGPITVAIVPIGRDNGAARTAYLDPPSGRVLAVASGGPGASWSATIEAPPLASPAQPVARVIARAAPIGGGEVREVAWPTTRSPDWTVGFAGGAARRVKVADDSGSARPVLAREQGGVIAHAGVAWLIVAGGVLAVVGMTAMMRRGRRRPVRR